MMSGLEYVLPFLFTSEYINNFLVWSMEIECAYCLCSQMTGIISVSAKLVPTFMNFLKKLAEEGQQMSGNQSFSDSSTVNSGNYTKSQYKRVPMQELASFTASSETSSLNGEDYAGSLRHRQQANKVAS